tara:strand:- start:1481 stop:2308 length:828 start_codon:yes stop_codon:yes gene_type:complete
MNKPTHNIDNNEYHRGQLGHLLSSSDMKVLYRKSGAHLEVKKSQVNHETPLMALGTAFHSLMLEPETFDQEYVILPEFEVTEVDKKTGEVKAKASGWKRTNDYKDQLSAFQKKNAGLRILTEDEMSQLLSMRTSMSKSSMFKEYFVDAEGHNEATYVDGRFKVRCDRICEVGHKTIIIDIKTTDDATPEGFKKKMHQMDYDLSAVMYSDIAKADEFIWVVQEREAPFACCWYKMSDWVHKLGLGKLNKAHKALEQQELPMGGFSGHQAEYEITEL